MVRINYVPQLQTADIAYSLDRMGITITEDDLTRPTIQNIEYIFDSLMFELCSYDSNNVFSYIQDYYRQTFDYPEPLEEVTNFFIFKKAMSNLMWQIGTADVLVSDLIRPDPGNIKKFLSESCNFAMFRDERMVVLEKYAMENEKNMKKYKALIQEEENLMKMLEESERQLDIEQPQVAEELKAFSELEGKIKLLQQKQHKLVEELDPLREDQETIEERLVPIRSKANENHSQIAELKSQIVYSPEKVKMGKIELKKSLENVKQLISTKSELLKQFESGNSRLEELEVDQDHFYKMVLENLEIRDRRKELELEVSSHNEIITQATSELNIMKNKEDNLKFFLAACIEKIDRLEAQKVNKVELLKEKVNSKHEDKMKIESMIEEILKKYEVGMKDVEKDKTDFEALKIRFQNEVNEANMLYTDMKNRLSLYQNAIGMSIAKCLSQYHK